MSDGPTGLVFRDEKTERPLRELARQAVRSISSAMREGPEAMTTALLDAAALEGALADTGHDVAAPLTDLVASRDPAALGYAEVLRDRTSDGSARVSTPEGFAHYGLGPEPFAEGVAALLEPRPTLIVGIRTAGVALSAALKARLGPAARRFTVRPHGHPYDRRVALTDEQRAQLPLADQIVIVDEGPGMSGSSFLATADALGAAGVPPSRIVLAGTRAVTGDELCAPDAGPRWRRYRSLAVPGGPPPPADGERELAVAWRAVLLRDRPWPAIWPAMERTKRWRDGHLAKFEGLGRFGRRRRDHAQALAAEGWCAPVLAGPDRYGLVTGLFVPGAPLGPEDGTPDLLATMGRYIAARARLFPAEPAPGLEEMVHTNLELEGVRPPPDLPIVRPCVTDGRLQPHEWIRTEGGHLLKTDAVAHGDDHFHPGPTDVAWDLAGAIVEWNLDARAREALVAAYTREAGEDPRPRLNAWILAYAGFRARYALMATHASPEEERPRWRAVHARCRSVLLGQALA